MTAFQILTLENWTVILYEALGSGAGLIIPPIYLISWIFIGNYVFLNLFLAILLDGFTEEGEEEMINQAKNKKQRMNEAEFYGIEQDDGENYYNIRASNEIE